MAELKNQCLETEMEYREWREAPLWYCVKTTLHNDGKIESEILADEKTKMPLVMMGAEKPQDAAFETVTSIIYYNYFAGYEAAERQVKAAKAATLV